MLRQLVQPRPERQVFAAAQLSVKAGAVTGEADTRPHLDAVPQRKAIHLRFPAVSAIKCRQDTQEGGLAGTVLALQQHHFAIFDSEVESAQHPSRTEPLLQPAGSEHQSPRTLAKSRAAEPGSSAW